MLVTDPKEIEICDMQGDKLKTDIFFKKLSDVVPSLLKDSHTKVPTEELRKSGLVAQ
jgi:hypothetical protein